ncbi:Inositol-pentakisphosphate 2-kinase [Cinara cedri]|uniref:Inositol-pentakisphosphate 2-kinase n=1 Tax=Cinara cedri TaxID=506608 RepID=A0A5E4NDC7_9HEMI|nr:Inositol-pentakisphosphate 2-kinase [Cinara cedri]
MAGPSWISESDNDYRLIMMSDHSRYYYKGEGNANIILGLPDNDDRVIMRVLKYDIVQDSEDHMKKSLMLNAQMEFCRMIRQMYFADYADVPLLTSMPVKDLRELDNRLISIRPHDRIHKRLWSAGGMVTVYADYTLLPRTVVNVGPVYCVEIKPKQGWLIDADRVAMSNFGLGSKCAFCSQQFTKVLKTREFSRYCPLDLFSGCRLRIEHAVKSLLQTPQNNLKMFMDGVPVDWSDCTTLFGGRASWLARFVAAALLGDCIEDLPVPLDVDEDDSQEHPAYPKNRVCNFNTKPMPSTCVLQSILAMQKAQTCGFSKVCEKYKRLAKCGLDADLFGHVSRLQSPPDHYKRITEPVDNYLMAVTARDCSVFVTFCQTIDADGCATIKFDGCRYAVRVKVGDLDPKPLTTIDKHRQRNIEIMKSCYSFFDRSIKCKKCMLPILDCSCDNMFTPVNII